MLSSIPFKTLCLALAVAVVPAIAQCDRTCDIHYFANVSPPTPFYPILCPLPTPIHKNTNLTSHPSQYDDLPSGTTLTGANPYLGLQYSVYTVRDFTGNGVITVPSGPNALIAINPVIPTNRATINANRDQIRILDPESAFLACVTVDKGTYHVWRGERGKKLA